MRSKVINRGRVIPGQLNIFVTLIAASVHRDLAIVGNGAKSKVTFVTQSTEFFRCCCCESRKYVIDTSNGFGGEIDSPLSLELNYEPLARR